MTGSVGKLLDVRYDSMLHGRKEHSMFMVNRTKLLGVDPVLYPMPGVCRHFGTDPPCSTFSELVAVTICHPTDYVSHRDFRDWL